MDYLNIVSNVGTNFTSEMFKEFCSKMSIQQSVTSSYPHQSNSQVEACKTFVKHTVNKCLDTNQDIIIALLKVHSTAVGAGLPSPATVLFNRPIQGLSPQMNKDPINIDNNDPHSEVLGDHLKNIRTTVLTHSVFFQGSYSSSPVGRVGGCGCTE